MIDQHKVVHNCEVEGKWYMALFIIIFLQIKTEKCGVQKYSSPFTLILLNKIQRNQFPSEVT